MEYQILLAFVMPALIVFSLTPFAVHFATMVGAIDQPNERKIHQHPTPRLGGIAICIGFLLSLLILSRISAIKNIPSPLVSLQGISFIIALILVFFTGVADDIRSINPGKKFLAQALAAAIVCAGGFRISTVTSFMTHEPLNLGALELPATVLWIVGITNAFNLIDGLDGLASGVGIMAALSMSAISYFNGTIGTALVALALAGAIAGFLYYNFHPAKIFLGDSGSLLIGFTLAVLSISTSTKGSTTFAVVISILALGLPIMDTVLAMLRRLLVSFLPERKSCENIFSRLHSMFLPDRRHIHHQLVALGLSHQNVVLVLYLVSFVFGAGALAVTVSNNIWASLVLIVLGLAMIAGIRQLKYKEMAILSNGMLLPIYEWPVTHQRMFQGFLDVAFSAIAFVFTYNLTKDPGAHAARTMELVPIITLVCGTQLAIFSLSGLYRRVYRYAEIGEVLKILKTTVFAVAATGLILASISQNFIHVTMAVHVTDFYLLTSLVVGSRISYHVLNFLFRRKNAAGAGVLIYGARINGILMLQHILHNESLHLHPIGFLDDDPSLEGKDVSGYPVFGGHWKLRSLLRKHKIDEILIASDTMKQEVLDRLKQFSEEYGISVYQRKISFEEIPVTHSARYAKQRKALLERELEASVVSSHVR
ncbi:MAG: hypothetical protein KGJ59_03525 [Bacteroidota bacterium]|nr:hypothetical protein [Bacteroidota bacterium]